MHVLRVTGMEKKAHHLPPTLSGGEQQRVAVARAVVGEPAIILADEPTGSLDSESAQKVLDLLLQYHKNGATILVASHNISLLKNIADGRNIALETGNLKASPPCSIRKEFVTI